jgi:hypothetical protein
MKAGAKFAQFIYLQTRHEELHNVRLSSWPHASAISRILSPSATCGSRKSGICHRGRIGAFASEAHCPYNKRGHC